MAQPTSISEEHSQSLQNPYGQKGQFSIQAEVQQKFSRSLETTLSTTSDLDKDEFIRKIKTNIGWMGMESFFTIAKPDGSVVSLVDNHFVFKVEDVLQEFTSCLVESGPTIMGADNMETSRSIAHRFKCFDTYELDDIGMSRLMVESLLTQSFLQKIETRFSHIDDYELVSGACLFMMALDACNAKESMDIEGVKTAFAALDINSYEGQNVSEFITEAMRLIKIMNGEYFLDCMVVEADLELNDEYFNEPASMHQCQELILI